MKTGIIGAGNIGSALAGHFRKLGHSVLIANSRGPETLSQVVQATGAVAVAIRDTAKGVDLLVIISAARVSGVHGREVAVSTGEK